MNKIESHLSMYVDRTAKGEDPPSLQEVEEALDQASTNRPKAAVLPRSSVAAQKIGQEGVVGRIDSLGKNAESS